jgi:hypothetical protein
MPEAIFRHPLGVIGRDVDETGVGRYRRSAVIRAELVQALFEHGARLGEVRIVLLEPFKEAIGVCEKTWSEHHRGNENDQSISDTISIHTPKYIH